MFVEFANISQQLIPFVQKFIAYRVSTHMRTLPLPMILSQKYYILYLRQQLFREEVAHCIIVIMKSHQAPQFLD